MKTKLFTQLLITLFTTGCQLDIYQSDIIPPSQPRGLYTVTGDNFIEIFWISNPEHDIAGYRVYVGSTYSGQISLIGETRIAAFIDHEARNGHTYYYAITAYDNNGNESELSKDVVYDTPRPEGYDVKLMNFRVYPSLAGYDFSTYSIGDYDDNYTDIFFEYYDGIYYLNVWEDTDVQDMGYTNSLYEISTAPTRGWSPTKDAQLIVGHIYIVRIWDNHYAKVRVESLSSSRVTFDWAYQLQSGNPRLKHIELLGRSPLKPGAGFIQRNGEDSKL